jgi:hypothetical protein
MSLRVLAAPVAALVLCAPARADDAELAATLRQVVAGNLAAYDREDVDATMSFVHTKSPDYASTQSALQAQFEALDVTTELVDFAYIGHDDEFAIARVRAKTADGPGNTFTDNTVDAIVIFHQENGAWKLWGDEILGIAIGQ